MVKHILLVLVISIPIFSATSVSTTVTASTGTTTPTKPPAIHHIFEESSKETHTIINWIETIQDGKRHIINKNNHHTETTIGNTSASYYAYNNPTDNIVMAISINDGIASIAATSNGQTITSTVPLNGDPFMYPPGFYMKAFLHSSNDRQFIWVANKKDLTIRQMIFTKLGEESIEQKEEPSIAIK